MSKPADIKCWICGEAATTGEHKTKRSDLKAVFGEVNQAAPIYFHDASRRNRPVGSLNAKLLKSPGRLCASCNNARTQPHDRAWEKLSGWLRARRPRVSSGAIVRGNRVFPYNTRRQMLNVHLFFVKLFGCLIIEGNLPIEIDGFSRAILEEKAHPRVYIKFGYGSSNGVRPMGRSDMKLALLASDQSCAFATWFYWVDGVGVNVMYAIDGEQREGLVGAWHPRFGTNKLVFADFNDD